jgi:hypothetical protein
MIHLKMLGQIALMAAALVAVAGVGTASATTLAITGVVQNRVVETTATVKAGTSNLLKDEFGTTTDTCTESLITADTESFTNPSIGGIVTKLVIGKCTHTTTVIAPGKVSFTWTSGSNGTVSSSGTEVTVQSTFFGASAVCKTGAGTNIGTLTGVSEGNATLDINAALNCGILGKASWTGTYIYTSPHALKVVP